MLLRHAGQGRNLPADFAERHDHYAHGKPKQLRAPMIDEIRWIVSYMRRSRDEPSIIRSIIEAEGCQVHSSRQLGTFKRSPFRGIRPYPILYEFRVRYGQRYGSWFVRTSRGSSVFDWVWSDEFGNETLPIERSDALVDNNAVPVGYLSNFIAVFGLIAIGVTAGVAIYWYFF